MLVVSSIAALGLSLGCEYIPEGVPLYGECSRPVKEIRDELLRYKEEERCVSTGKVRDCGNPNDLFVIYENTAVQEHTSCLADFITESFADKGLIYNKNEDAELVIVPVEDYLDYSTNGGDGVTLGDGVTIVIPNSFQTDIFHQIVNHEIGHTVEPGKEEFLSLFHENYSYFKTFQQDPEYGSLMFMEMFYYWYGRKEFRPDPLLWHVLQRIDIISGLSVKT